MKYFQKYVYQLNCVLKIKCNTHKRIYVELRLNVLYYTNTSDTDNTNCSTKLQT